MDFFWMVVHELRQPLTSISGQAQIAKEFLATDPIRATRALEHVVTDIRRIDRLLVELHDRAREGGHTPAP
jgi:signal transduction histidine kinase